MKYIFFILLFLITTSVIFYFFSQQKPKAKNPDGATLFNKNCAPCHKPDKGFTGPALKGSLLRWGGDKKAMYAFIRNPAQSATKNAYAKELFKKWKVLMTCFQLSDEELDAMMDYWEKKTP